MEGKTQEKMKTQIGDERRKKDQEREHTFFRCFELKFQLRTSESSINISREKLILEDMT